MPKRAVCCVGNGLRAASEKNALVSNFGWRSTLHVDFHVFLIFFDSFPTKIMPDES